jgi:hypothetical protein
MSRKIRAENGQRIEDPVIREFLDSKKESTRKTYESNFRKVLEFTKGESGQSMLDNASLWSKKIVAFQQWLKGQGLTSVEPMTGMLRGFFGFHDKQLNLSTATRRQLGDKGEREHEDYIFSQSDVKKMSDIANLEEKYVLLCGPSFGLRSEDFVKITYGKYRLALENAEKEEIGVPIPLGKMRTEKENVDAYPFISSDALPIIQTLLETHKDAKDEDRVFTARKTQLTEIVQKLFKKAGLEAHGQHVRFHKLGKGYLFDRLLAVASDSKARQIVGDKVKGEITPYIGEDSLRTVYERAMPSIVVSNGNGEVKKKVAALDNTVENLIRMLAEKDKTIADLKRSDAEKDKKIEELTAAQTKTESTFSKLMSLPTIQREMLKQKEKAFDSENPT